MVMEIFPVHSELHHRDFQILQGSAIPHFYSEYLPFALPHHCSGHSPFGGA